MKKALIILLTVLCTFLSINYVYAEETNNNENVPVEITEVTPTFSVENISYNQNEINIDVVDGADVYYIYYSTNKTKGFKRIESINPTYIHRSLTSGKTYYYKVRAVKFVDGKNTYSAYSNVVGRKVIPSTTNVKVASTSYKGIKITWDKVSGASGYVVYRSTDGKSYKAIKTLTNKYTSYTNSSLNTGTKYYYKVRAYRVVNRTKVYSKYSNVVYSTPYLKVPKVDGTNNYYRYARINITKVSGATGYVVYRSTEEEGTYNKIGTTSNLYYLDKTATEGETYYYKVRAYRKVNKKNKYSDYSETVEAMKLNDDISYTVSNNSYNSTKITIQKDELATKYYIYRATSSKGTYTLIKTLYGKDYEGDITYTDTKLTFNKTYYYKVRKYYKNASDYSNVEYIKTRLNAPILTLEETEGAKLSYKSSGADGYEIYRSVLNEEFKRIKTTTKTIFVDNYDGNRVSYKVRAYRIVSRKKIYSAFSNIEIYKENGPAEDECYIVREGEILKYTCTEENVVIPEVINGETITKIGREAFSNTEVKSVVIPDTVTEIGMLAFSMVGLTEVTLPKNLEIIGEDAFSYNSLTNVVLPENVKTIGNSAFFSNNTIESVTLNEGLLEIGQNAFQHNKLVNVVIPNSVTKIDDIAFGNNMIESLVLSNTLEYLGGSAFSNNNIKDVVLPDTLTYLGDNVFYQNELNSLVIPGSIKTIKKNHFSGTKIKELTIKSGVLDIENNAFEYCDVTKANISAVNIKSNAFWQNAITELTLGETIQNIGYSAFGNNQITSLILPDSVIEIGEQAFSYNKINSLTLNTGLTKIGVSAFIGNEIQSLTIPNTVTEIGMSAFSSNAITTLEIPGSVKTLGDSAFSNNQLNSVKLNEGLESIGENAFANNSITELTIPGSVKTMGGFIAQGSKLNRLVFSEGVTKIDDYSFMQTEISELVLPSTLKEIGEQAFWMTNLKTLELPEGLTTIKNDAFYSCKIENLVLPSTLKTIGSRAFCSNSINNLTLNEGLTSIGEEAFMFNKLTNLVIPASVTEIGKSAFAHGYSLTGVQIKGKNSSSEFTLYGPTPFDNAWDASNSCTADNTSNVENGCIIWGVN